MECISPLIKLLVRPYLFLSYSNLLLKNFFFQILVNKLVSAMILIF